MSFLHVGLLSAGIAGILIPIVIHWLFRQRRRPIEWGAMRYLLEAFQRARHRMRMEQWILLLLRCAIVLLFALALGRLLLSGGMGGAGGVLGSGSGGGRVVYLLIDNGVTAGVNGEDGGTGLGAHQAKALEILGALQASDRVGLLTLARPSDVLIDPPALDHGAVGEILAEIELSDGATEFERGFEGLRESIAGLPDDGAPVLVYLLSDFYRGAADLGPTLPEFLSGVERSVRLYASAPASAVVENVQLVSVTPTRSMLMKQATDGSGQVRLHLRRSGDVNAGGVTAVRLATLGGLGAEGWVDDGEAVTLVNWEAGQRDANVEFALPFDAMETGTVGLRVAIGGDGLAADNVRYVTVEVREDLRVGIVDRREYAARGDLQNLSAGAWFGRALNPGLGSRILIEDVDPAVVEPAALVGLDALFVCQPDLVTAGGWDAIGEFVGSGGLVWLVPSVDQTVALWPDLAVEALDLPWVFAREVVEFGGEDEEDGGGVFLAEEQPDAALLGMLRGERDGLVQPIVVERYLPILEGVESGGAVLELRDDVGDGDAGIWMASSVGEGGGLVIYLASPPHLSWTSLPAKPLMVALVQETLRQGLSLGYARGDLMPGDRPILRVSSAATGLARLDVDGGDEDEDGGVQLARSDGVVRPMQIWGQGGMYGAVDGRGGVTDLLVVNVDANAAIVEVQGGDDVLAWLGRSGDWEWVAADDLTAGVRTEMAKAEVSLILLVLVFVLAIVETILARRFSHAYRSARDMRVGTSVEALTGTLGGQAVEGGRSR